MKKITLLLLHSLFLSNLSAQNWCPPGATWYYEESSSFLHVNGVIKLEYVRDTTINTVTAKIIKGTFTGMKPTISSAANFTIFPNYLTYITYENNKVVYLYNNGVFDTVVNYNANIGDKWFCLRNYAGCGIKRQLTVTDTGHQVINGLSLRRIVTKDTNKLASPSTAIRPHINVYLEKLYNRPGGYVPNPLFNIYCDAQEISAENAFISLRCYQDNNFSLYNTTQTTCDNITGILESQGSDDFLRTYPNPATNKLMIVSPKRNSAVLEIIVMDGLGSIVYTGNIHSASQSDFEFDMSTFKSGIYFIQILDHKKLIAKTKVIKE